MAIYTPVIVVVASLTIVLIVIELATVFLYPVWVIMFDPSVFVIQWHTILFDMLVANIACNLVFPLFFVTWNAGAKHIRDKIRGNCITLFDARMTITVWVQFPAKGGWGESIAEGCAGLG